MGLFQARRQQFWINLRYCCCTLYGGRGKEEEENRECRSQVCLRGMGMVTMGDLAAGFLCCCRPSVASAIFGLRQ